MGVSRPTDLDSSPLPCASLPDSLFARRRRGDAHGTRQDRLARRFDPRGLADGRGVPRRRQGFGRGDHAGDLAGRRVRRGLVSPPRRLAPAVGLGALRGRGHGLGRFGSGQDHGQRASPDPGLAGGRVPDRRGLPPVFPLGEDAGPVVVCRRAWAWWPASGRWSATRPGR